MKRYLLVVVILAMALIMAACGSSEPAAPAAEPAATEAPAAEPAATEAPAAEPAATEAPAAEPAAEGATCEDPLGCVEIAAGDPIKIAYAMVVAGPNASLGEDSVRGMEIAVEDAGGELLGHPIEISGEDTGCAPEGGQAAATKLASDTSLVAIVGTSCSSEARVAAPILTEAGLTMISASNTAPDLTDPEKRVDGYFRTAHNDLVQGAVAAEFAFNSLGLKKAATIHDGSLYAVGLTTAFANSFKELGGEIVSEQAVNVGDTDMRPVLTTVASDAPEIIYYPIFTAEGGFITAQSKEVPGLENTKLMGADGMFSQDFVSAAGDAALGMYLSSPDFSAFGDQYATFLEKHEAKYGEPPLSAFHAHAYDATNIFLAAIEAVAIQNGDGLLIPRQALRDAVAATSGFQGLTGSLTCDPNGDCADPKIAVYEVTDVAAWNPNVTSPMKIFP